MTNVFREHKDWHDRNRDLVNSIEIYRAVLSTGAEGVFMKVGGLPIPMTRAEAVNIATRIADNLERITP